MLGKAELFVVLQIYPVKVDFISTWLDEIVEENYSCTFENKVVRRLDINLLPGGTRAKDEEPCLRIHSFARMSTGIAELKSRTLIECLDGGTAKSIKIAEAIGRKLADVCVGRLYALPKGDFGIALTSETLKEDAKIYENTNFESFERFSEHCQNNSRWISMKWSLPADRDSSRDLLAVVQKLQTIFPSAVPLLYGLSDYDSFLGGSGNRHLLEVIDSANRAGMQSDWYSFPPLELFHFLSSIDEASSQVKPERFANRRVLDLSIPLAVIAGQKNGFKLLSEFFTVVSQLVGAFFASAIVQHSYQERYDLDNSLLWEGLPALPYWLGWFGISYAPYLQDSLKDCEYAFFIEDRYIFLKMGEEPVDLGTLRQIFPTLPSRLLQTEVHCERGAGSLVPRFEAAEFIPPMT
ncbi:MAG: hypothetical protein LCH63_14250 [Candidatus Melainabacteria bacterium]|nr:hypothetical protein [Candidatus Melainabacteria bacterium]